MRRPPVRDSLTRLRREWSLVAPDDRRAIRLLLIMGTAVTGLMLYRGIWVFAGLMAFAFLVAAVVTFVEDPSRHMGDFYNRKPARSTVRSRRR